MLKEINQKSFSANIKKDMKDGSFIDKCSMNKLNSLFFKSNYFMGKLFHVEISQNSPVKIFFIGTKTK